MLRCLPRPPRARTALVALAIATAAGCGLTGEGGTQPTSADEGIQATGQIDGSRVAISRGAPIVIVGDCDPEDGADEDLCIGARTIDGLAVSLVIENRDALVEDTTVPIGRASCVDGCDGVTDEVIARLELGGRTIEVIDGQFDVARADDRFVADFDLTLPFGDSLDGTFDVAERLPVENPSGVLRSVGDDDSPAQD